jgi:DNA ligase (NAD+)
MAGNLRIFTDYFKMMNSNTKARHSALVSQLTTANQEYYGLSRPSLTDQAYDDLMKELRALEETHPELKSPITTQVGHEQGIGQKVKHLRPMQSLDNVFSPDELRKFFKTDYQIIWEPKVDGLSLSLHYEDGRLVKAVTRGDGVEGEDVTHNAMVIHSVPKKIHLKEAIEVRGEVFIAKADFASLVAEMIQEGDEPFANARNAASGSLKLKDSEEAAKRKLQFVGYAGFGLSRCHTQTEICTELRGLGFRTTTTTPIPMFSINDEMMRNIDGVRKELDFDTDGVVFKIDDLAIREEIGIGSKSPKWACAYKFPPEEGVTKLSSIVLQVGRTGTINPVAILQPITLNGAVVQRASLCNFDEIKRLDIAYGDDVIVIRAAEVIPKVTGVKCKAANRIPIQIPTHCPSCSSTLVKDPELVAYFCPAIETCPAQAFERLAHAVNKTSLDWDGFGSAQVQDFVNRGMTRLSSIMKAAESELSWMKPAAKKKFLSERERIKTVPLWRKLHALGVNSIGKTFCKELSFKYGNIFALAEDYEGVKFIVGPNRAKVLFEFLAREADELERLDKLGYSFEDKKEETAQTKATGKSFVITGTLITGSREDVSAKIEQAGGVAKSSVGKTTDYLVVGESPGNNKTSAATKHGTKIISEEELYTLLGLDFKVASNPLDTVNMDDL